MSRRTKVKTFSIKNQNAHWFEKECEKEDLSQSAVMNRMIKIMRKSGSVLFGGEIND